ncbi:MAG: hypothetical protein HYZ45_00440 [Burkholderiales bacterium]|nr:hypothetical protein [Burkholderiales bacterium]
MARSIYLSCRSMAMAISLLLYERDALRQRMACVDAHTMIEENLMAQLHDIDCALHEFEHAYEAKRRLEPHTTSYADYVALIERFIDDENDEVGAPY